MSHENGNQTAQSLLGISDSVILWYPCMDCAHPFEDHLDGKACREHNATLGYKPAAMPEAPLEPIIGPCPCESFAGLLEDGKPRAIKMRMPSNYEWSSIMIGASLPIQGITAADKAPMKAGPQKRQQRHEWARRLAMTSITHVRQSGDSWQAVRVVDRLEDVAGPWDIAIDTLDYGGGELVDALAMSLIIEYNDGGPFGGKVRPFLANRARDVRAALPDVPSDDAARASTQLPGRSGGMDPSDQDRDGFPLHGGVLPGATAPEPAPEP